MSPTLRSNSQLSSPKNSLSSVSNTQTLSMNGLPPVPMSPTLRSNSQLSSPKNSLSSVSNTQTLSMNGLLPVPMSPTLPSAPSSPTGKRVISYSMDNLPSVPSSPTGKRVICYSMDNLPSVPSSPVVSSESNIISMEGLQPVPTLTSKQYPTEKVDLASMSVATYKVWPQIQPTDHIDAILSLPLYDIPTLEEVLSKTTQPFLRQRLEIMIADQKKARKSPTRGWSARSPQKGLPRHQLMDQCGKGCFLKTDTEGFPICPKCNLGNGNCVCAIDCGGVQAAKNRARQYGHDSIADLADKLLATKCNMISNSYAPTSYVPRS